MQGYGRHRDERGPQRPGTAAILLVVPPGAIQKQRCDRVPCRHALPAPDQRRSPVFASAEPRAASGVRGPRQNQQPGELEEPRKAERTPFAWGGGVRFYYCPLQEVHPSSHSEAASPSLTDRPQTQGRSAVSDGGVWMQPRPPHWTVLVGDVAGRHFLAPGVLCS